MKQLFGNEKYNLAVSKAVSRLNNRRFYRTDSYTFKDNKLQLKKIDESVQTTFSVFLKSIIFAFVS